MKYGFYLPRHSKLNTANLLGKSESSTMIVFLRMAETFSKEKRSQIIKAVRSAERNPLLVG